MDEKDEEIAKLQARIKELEDCLEWLLEHGWNTSKVMRVLKASTYLISNF
jgi:hypothetical protein